MSAALLWSHFSRLYSNKLNMTKINRFLLLALVVTFTFGTYGCKRDKAPGMSFKGFTSDALTHVPANAAMVGRIDIQGLMDKADFEEMKDMEFYRDMVKEAGNDKKIVADMLENPELSGIDLAEYMYFFAAPSENRQQKNFGGVVCRLADATQFETLVATIEKINIEKKEGWFLATTRDNVAIGWTDNLAVISGGERRNIENDIVKIFNTKKGNSILKNEALNKAFGTGHDITVWANSEAMAESMYDDMKMQMAFMGLKKKDLTDNHFNTYIDFEDGFMVADSRYMLSKALDKEFDMITGKEVTTDFTPYIPAENLNTVMSMALNYEGIYKKLKESGMMGFANMGLAEYDMTVEDIAKIFENDLVFASYNNGKKTKSSALLMTTIKDKKRFNKVLQIGKDIGFLNALGDDEYELVGAGGMLNEFGGTRGSGTPKLLVDGDRLFITDRSDIMSQVKRGTFARADRISGKAADVLRGHTMGMYVDAKGIENVADELDGNYVEDMFFTFGSDKSEVRINTLNKNQNSLKTFIEMMNEQHKKENIENDWFN